MSSRSTKAPPKRDKNTKRTKPLPTRAGVGKGPNRKQRKPQNKGY